MCCATSVLLLAATPIAPTPQPPRKSTHPRFCSLLIFQHLPTEGQGQRPGIGGSQEKEEEEEEGQGQGKAAADTRTAACPEGEAAAQARSQRLHSVGGGDGGYYANLVGVGTFTHLSTLDFRFQSHVGW